MASVTVTLYTLYIYITHIYTTIKPTYLPIILNLHFVKIIILAIIFLFLSMLLNNTLWENKLSYGKDIDKTIHILYSIMLDIFSKTVPMSKLSTNAHK